MAWDLWLTEESMRKEEQMMSEKVTFPRNTVPHPSPLFAEALRTDSNLELEWLWLAERLANDAERAYSLRRALYINPANETARRKLQEVDPSTGAFPAAGWKSRLRRLAAHFLAL